MRPWRLCDTRHTPESRPWSGDVRFLDLEVRWRSILETVPSGRSFRSLFKQSKEHEAASFGLMASLPPKADVVQKAHIRRLVILPWQSVRGGQSGI